MQCRFNFIHLHIVLSRNQRTSSIIQRHRSPLIFNGLSAVSFVASSAPRRSQLHTTVHENLWLVPDTDDIRRHNNCVSPSFVSRRDLPSTSASGHCVAFCPSPRAHTSEHGQAALHNKRLDRTRHFGVQVCSLRRYCWCSLRCRYLPLRGVIKIFDAQGNEMVHSMDVHKCNDLAFEVVAHCPPSVPSKTVRTLGMRRPAYAGSSLLFHGCKFSSHGPDRQSNPQEAVLFCSSLVNSALVLSRHLLPILAERVRL